MGRALHGANPVFARGRIANQFALSALPDLEQRTLSILVDGGHVLADNYQQYTSLAPTTRVWSANLRSWQSDSNRNKLQLDICEYIYMFVAPKVSHLRARHKSILRPRDQTYSMTKSEAVRKLDQFRR